MADRADITPELLRQLFRYDAETGHLIWLPRPPEMFEGKEKNNCGSWNAKNAGKIAGTIDAKGYRRTRVNGVSILMHRIVWAIIHGRWPEQCIDHIDHNKLNNRIENLRDCSSLQNFRNQRLSKHNTSGVSGVSWSKANQKWHVRIGNGGSRKYLGHYPSFDEAVAVKRKAERELGYHTNHGAKL